MTPIRLRVPELRTAKGWTQQELARKAGVSRLTVINVERGDARRVDFDVLEKLADALGVDPAVLLERTPKGRGKRAGGD